LGRARPAATLAALPHLLEDLAERLGLALDVAPDLAEDRMRGRRQDARGRGEMQTVGESLLVGDVHGNLHLPASARRGSRASRPAGPGALRVESPLAFASGRPIALQILRPWTTHELELRACSRCSRCPSRPRAMRANLARGVLPPGFTSGPRRPS